MKEGLYHPDEFRDNCGFGLIAHIKGETSHKLLQTAIESLTCMTHRGGIAADGKTGDGCGLLMQLPESYLRALAHERFEVELADHFGVAMCFLNRDPELASKARQVMQEECAAEGLTLVGWREVPIDPSCCGEIALQSLPKIEQAFIDAPELSQQQLNIKLFVARRKVEKRVAGSAASEGEKSDSEFYISSMSASVLCYKGLMMPADLPIFYKDLDDPRLKTAICVFHQRFSTNTLPKWPLAQPFRLLAHNGEINTIRGNRNWANARTTKFLSDALPDIESIAPLVNRSGSDSSSMDNMLELLVTGGMDLFRAVRLMMPPAWQNVETMDADLKAFYEFNSMHMEPWDGPAGLVLTDGRYATCMLDRNGLRPARYVITKDDFITVASEVGTHGYKSEDVVAKGRVGPGQILAIDTLKGELLFNDTIDEQLKTRQPYRRWLRDNAMRIAGSLEKEHFDGLAANEFDVYMKQFQVSFEERDQVMRPLAEAGQEATGSMGDDTPMAVMSEKVRSPFDYFRQQFAQVTNPPIDPLRETVVMSLETCVGAELNIFTETPEHANRVILTSPLLSPAKMNTLLTMDRAGFQSARISLLFNAEESSLEEAIHSICADAEAAVKAGSTLLVLSDRGISQNSLPVHSLLATGAVHHHLISKSLRCNANLIVETAVARDSHHFATLIGFGATAVYPYLAYNILHDLVDSGELLGDADDAMKNYRRGINKGLLKILSKMGISTIASYRGAQLFEAVGLDNEVTELCFRGVASRISGSRLSDLEADLRILGRSAWRPSQTIEQGGLLKYVHNSEYHAFNPDVVAALQNAVQTGDSSAYRDYAGLVNERPASMLRDLLALKSDAPAISLDDVEPIEQILLRFDSAGMSLGALSPEAHESLAAAMNRLGGRSNSGEGGEDPERYGTERNSKIKQIASGRFGVTPHYLVNAEVLQIKVAQGAKPGEGGQLPGGKVNALIARLRYSVPGVTLISPPPHHDIYSIEDLAQLIFDLKQVNPQALISVKLVSEPGVGTIAAGVAKAYADLITISGYDGGTAASPLTSIRYAGSPWELGLSETHQALRSNDLRDKVRVQTDGGLKTGLDVVKAAILGAESFGFGTTPMVAMGCKYLRICHLNNCATGVATQNDTLRDEHFIGTVDMVVNFFRFVAEETREIMASLGVSKMEDLIGRTDLLERIEGNTARQKNIDLEPLLQNDHIDSSKPQFCTAKSNDPFDKAQLAERMVATCLPAIESKTGGKFDFPITNCDRSIGARISGEIARRYGNYGMSDNPIDIQFLGTAGQSFGAWNAGGLRMHLEGDANDYVGKGMAGGQLVIYPPRNSTFNSQEAAIIGNTCLYGATGGQLYAAGRAGERFGVRNSGAMAVVEGAGDHCCEYMTGGVITVLGSTGYNFGAGMTGGFAYVLDLDRLFPDLYNRELVEICRIAGETFEPYKTQLYAMLQKFVAETDSAWGQEVMEDFDHYIGKFWLIKPKASSLKKLLDNVRSAPA